MLKKGRPKNKDQENEMVPLDESHLMTKPLGRTRGISNLTSGEKWWIANEIIENRATASDMERMYNVDSQAIMRWVKQLRLV